RANRARSSRSIVASRKGPCASRRPGGFEHPLVRAGRRFVETLVDEPRIAPPRALAWRGERHDDRDGSDPYEDECEAAHHEDHPRGGRARRDRRPRLAPPFALGGEREGRGRYVGWKTRRG